MSNLKYGKSLLFLLCCLSLGWLFDLPEFIIIILILGISFFFLYPHYQKYTYMEDCKQNGHQKDWCEKTWLELLELE